MHSKIITFFALVATALAAPQVVGSASADDNDLTVGDAAQMCGNNQALSCCNTNHEGGDGLLGGVLSGLLGGSCSQLNLPIIGGLVPIGDACGSNVAACCDGDQNGLVNVACTPITNILRKKN